MNFDRLFISLLKDEPEPKINEKNLIKEKFTSVDHSGELFVFFPPWHNSFKENKRIRKYLVKNKKSFIEYGFNANCLSSDPKLTLNYFRKIEKFVLKEINELIIKKKFKKIHIIGLSLGCAYACMVAGKLKKIDSLTLITPGNSLAEALWKGIKTQNIRKNFEKKGIDLKKLERIWKPLDPIENLKKVSCNNFKIYLSKSDKVVPYSCGKKMVDSLNKKNIELYENKFLGHYLTAIEFFLFPKKFIKIS